MLWINSWACLYRGVGYGRLGAWEVLQSLAENFVWPGSLLDLADQGADTCDVGLSKHVL